MDAHHIALGMLWYLVFLFSTTCHEAAHAFAALRGGDPTAALAGQASLNPAPHIRREPMGTVAIPLLSYFLGGFMIGWASAPFDPDWQRRHPHRAAWMALAGPAANFLLAAMAAGTMMWGLDQGWLSLPETGSLTASHLVVASSEGWAALTTLLSITYVLNLLLGVFNLLPAPPLDGATAIGLFLSEERAREVTGFLRNPTVSLLGILLAWSLFGEVFHPILEWTLVWILSAS
jgi:Zn-dependent protease